MLPSVRDGAAVITALEGEAVGDTLPTGRPRLTSSVVGEALSTAVGVAVSSPRDPSEADGASVYRGNVIITQGTLEVTAEEVEILTADSEVLQIIASAGDDPSDLAHYEQQTNEDNDIFFLVGNPADVDFVGLQQIAVAVDPDETDEEQLMDFSMM